MTHNHSNIALGVFLLALVASGCGKTDLDRASAKGLLSKDNSLSAINHIHLDYSCLEKEGFAKKEFVGYAPTPASQEVFSQLDGRDFGDLKNPAQAAIKEITGISGDENEKLVEYTIELNNTHPVVSMCSYYVKKPRKARFKKYDDGWRLEDSGIHVIN